MTVIKLFGIGLFTLASFAWCQPVMSQSVGINTGGVPNTNSMLEVKSANKGILIPRIDYANRPTTNVTSGMLIFVTANGPDGNNGYYYYSGSAWLRFYHIKEAQTLSLSNNIITINPGNSVNVGDVFPIQGYIKCGLNYINPLTDNNNCGSCGHVCTGGQVCTNGSCL